MGVLWSSSSSMTRRAIRPANTTAAATRYGRRGGSAIFRSRCSLRPENSMPEERAAIRPPPIRSFGINSQRIIHVEFDRVRGHLAAHHLAHFQFDVAVDDVVVEDAAGLEERAVLVEIGEGVAERAADGRDSLYFLWRQIVEILVYRLA